MCRWLAHTGSPILVEDLLHRPEHVSLAPTVLTPAG
jgi:hypothetical protein